MISFLKLIRWKNLFLIALSQILVKYALIEPFGVVNFTLNTFSFCLLVTATLLIAAAGYIINDIFDIETDGSINPKDALTEAAKILIHHFMLFSDERITLEADEIAQTETYDEESLHMRQLLKTRLIDMDLSVRALNCLKAAEVDTLGDLVSFNKSDLMKFRNFGKKSLTELEELVNVKGLNFGMDLVKYKLDRD